MMQMYKFDEVKDALRNLKLLCRCVLTVWCGVC
jgi:hypothetical protein